MVVKFLFFFLQEFCFKNTLFDDGTENDFFFSVKCLYEFSVVFFCLSSVFQNKNLIFSYVIESSDLCACSIFFSLGLWFGYFVVTS